MDALTRGYKSPHADGMQRALSAIRAAIQKFPLVPANKAILARIHDDDGWNVVRPPLVPLSPDAKHALFASLDALGFRVAQAVPAR